MNQVALSTVKTSNPVAPLSVYNQELFSEISLDPSGHTLKSVINNNSNLKQALTIRETGFISIDVNKTMINLIQVSDLLRMAYAGSRGLPCSTPILGMQSDYQDLVKMSMVTTGAFFRASLNAVEFHNTAVMMLDEAMKPENEDSKKDLIAGAMEMLQECRSVATDMAKHCDKLITKCDELIKAASNSLQTANNDSNATQAEKKKIIDKIAEMKAKQAGLQAAQNEYKLAIEKYDKEQKRLDDKAEKAMWVEFGATILSGLTQAAGTITAGLVGQSGKTAPQPVTPQKDPSASEQPAAEVTPEEVLKNKEEKAKNQADITKNEQALKDTKKKLDDVNKEIESIKDKDSEKLKVAKGKKEFLEKDITNKNKDLENLYNTKKAIDDAAKSFSNSLNKVAERAGTKSDSFSARAEEAGERAYKFRQLKAEMAGELEKTVVNLASLNISNNDVEKTLASLEVVLAVLGKIKTSFSNTKVFWEGVQAHCNALSTAGKSIEKLVITIKVPSMQQKIMSDIENTTIGWMSLAYINYRAYNAMKEAGAKVDEAMSNIPGAEECTEIVNRLSQSILSQLKAEHATNSEK
ncbi:hypothetical protein PULV_a3937 [Pseudoalteromonas ulvae UL12]|uniref:hypothetical protein n=1 Tax=Pseudoalteromonas ulvae TaxID=107327 RepID=UPI00186B5B25|nr:hypothetical protein [Pseudoalteromonas ulvae]MBE0362133.1 hypothetical protein [Pseudoalteromonas ulvae UL12]